MIQVLNIVDKIKALPQVSGVYIFKDEKKEVLYIGKATNLKNRVQSYFRGDAVVGRSEWITLMISKVVDIDFIQTDSVLEALILESNLIKKNQPKYNTLEKDDKSFSYFVITKEEFPKVLILRKTDIDFETGEAKSQKLKAIYGPYTSKYQMQVALKIIRRIFPFHAMRQKAEKGCLDFQLGLCPGPYADAISKIDYKKNIKGVEMILQGKKKRLISALEKEMLVHAKKDEFEKAAVLRNKIFALQHIRDVALMTRDMEHETGSMEQGTPKMRIEAYDISNISGTSAVGSMVVFINGKAENSQYRKFKIKSVEGSNDVAMMREMLSRRFNNNWEMPDLILLDGGQGHVNMASDLVKELGIDVLIVGVAKGKQRKNLNLAFASSNNISLEEFPTLIKEFLRNDISLKSIMDEAHRFAITYHRKLRGKNSLL
jgi:excinuclease ABC subunit C